MNPQKHTLTRVGLLATAAFLLAGCSATSDTGTDSVATAGAAPSISATMGDESPLSTGVPTSTSSASVPGASSSTSASASSSASGTASSGSSVSLAAGAEHQITSSGQVVTVDCVGGGDIDIEADQVELTFTGACEEIEVDGDENSITGEDAQSVDIEGDSNSATLGSVNEVSVDGDENSLSVDETGSIEVDGENNNITYVSGDPVIEIEGNNSISVG